MFLCFCLEDEQFNDEKTYLVKQIRDLQPSSLTSEGASDQ